MSADKQLLEVFQSVFGEEIESLNDTDSMDTVPGWDSAGHLTLIMAIEAEFGVQFEIEDIEKLVAVAEIRKRLGTNQAK